MKISIKRSSRKPTTSRYVLQISLMFHLVRRCEEGHLTKVAQKLSWEGVGGKSPQGPDSDESWEDPFLFGDINAKQLTASLAPKLDAIVKRVYDANR